MRKITVAASVLLFVALGCVCSLAYIVQKKSVPASKQNTATYPVRCGKQKDAFTRVNNANAMAQEYKCDDNQYTCRTLLCGGTDKAPVCCDKPNRYLSHCDCMCYEKKEDFNCSSYSDCLWGQ